MKPKAILSAFIILAAIVACNPPDQIEGTSQAFVGDPTREGIYNLQETQKALQTQNIQIEETRWAAVTQTAAFRKLNPPARTKTPRPLNIKTLTPSPSFTPTPLLHTLTPTSSILPSYYDRLAPLSSLAINFEEKTSDEGFPNFEYLIEKPFKVYDKTNELADRCIHDCLKKVWVDDHGSVTLIMIRTSSTRFAEIAVESEWIAFFDRKENADLIYAYDDYMGPPDKDWCAVGSFGSPVVYMTSHGPVIIMLLYYPQQGWMDDPSFIHEIFENLANEQINKLEKARYLP